MIRGGEDIYKRGEKGKEEQMELDFSIAFSFCRQLVGNRYYCNTTTGARLFIYGSVKNLTIVDGLSETASNYPANENNSALYIGAYPVIKKSMRGIVIAIIVVSIMSSFH